MKVLGLLLQQVKVKVAGITPPAGEGEGPGITPPAGEGEGPGITPPAGEGEGTGITPPDLTNLENQGEPPTSRKTMETTVQRMMVVVMEFQTDQNLHGVLISTEAQEFHSL